MGFMMLCGPFLGLWNSRWRGVVIVGRDMALLCLVAVVCRIMSVVGHGR